jgi:hypothetical protein
LLSFISSLHQVALDELLDLLDIHSPFKVVFLCHDHKRLTNRNSNVSAIPNDPNHLLTDHLSQRESTVVNEVSPVFGLHVGLTSAALAAG